MALSKLPGIVRLAEKRRIRICLGNRYGSAGASGSQVIKRRSVKAVIEALRSQRLICRRLFMQRFKHGGCGKKRKPSCCRRGKRWKFIASDVTALLKNTRDVVYMQDFEIVQWMGKACSSLILTETCWEENRKIEWNIEAAEKSGYPHFMLKRSTSRLHQSWYPFGRISELSGDVILGEVTLPMMR